MSKAFLVVGRNVNNTKVETLTCLDGARETHCMLLKEFQAWLCSNIDILLIPAPYHNSSYADSWVDSSHSCQSIA